MGLLVEGKALTPEEMKSKLKELRYHGITQFLNIWNSIKDRSGDQLKFGDEIEAGIFILDHSKKTIKLSLRSAEVREALIKREQDYAHQSEGCSWHPEFGAWMVESTPSRPYSNFVIDLLRVERNMVLRRSRLLAALNENEIAPTVTNFPLLGVADTINSSEPFSAPSSQSIYLPDHVINPHPRFAALTRNIRERRGSKVCIEVPLFKDLYTPEFLREEGVLAELPEGFTAEEGTNIHMDCMAFGMGMCCLQVTFQAFDVDESRYMYDQFAVLAPIMLAMTAASPIFKGRLSDVDGRWNVIAASVDDRTPAERGLLSEDELLRAKDPKMVGYGVQRLPKSRYDSISTYIYHCKGDADCQRTFAVYNDISCPIDEDVKSRLRDAGVDENLAQHIAHLYCRDPLVAFEGQTDMKDKNADHFESVQSTNWQTCRWKPPPPQTDNDEPIGWRTEFRSMEVQLTDFENAAFTVFIILITRVILAFDLALYLPLSKVDENMQRAQKHNAVKNQKFFARKHMAPPPSSYEEVEGKEKASKCSQIAVDGLLEADMFEEMTMDEIFNGKSTYYPGLIPLIYAYLDYIKCDVDTFSRMDRYLSFISRRAKGELVTPATWMRQFVLSHPAYKQDSVVSHEIAYDLMVTCSKIGDGSLPCPEILGNIEVKKVRKEDAYGHILAGRLTNPERINLLAALASRASQPREDTVARGVMPTEVNN